MHVVGQDVGVSGTPVGRDVDGISGQPVGRDVDCVSGNQMLMVFHLSQMLM